MEGIKLNNASVLENLEKIKEKINFMVKSIEKLTEAQSRYGEQFKDEISEKSSKIINDITFEIESLKDEIKTVINNLIAPLEELEEWRNW